MKAIRKKKFIPTKREQRFLAAICIHEQEFLDHGLATFGDIQARRAHIAKRLALLDESLGTGTVANLRRIVQETGSSAFKSAMPSWIALTDGPNDHPDGSSHSEDE